MKDLELERKREEIWKLIQIILATEGKPEWERRNRESLDGREREWIEKVYAKHFPSSAKGA